MKIILWASFSATFHYHNRILAAQEKKELENP